DDRANEAADEVMGQQLDEKCSVIGVEVLAGDLADADAVLQLCDDCFDFGTPVVVSDDVFRIEYWVVGDEGLHRVLEVGPELDLLACVAIEVASHNDAEGAFGADPASTLERKLCNLSKRLALGIDLDGAPVLGKDNRSH